MNKKIRFADLFCGIGGFHIALKSLGMECVFACEIDDNARKTYKHNFDDVFLNNSELFAKDIWSLNFKKIPDFEILCAGFPCQPFSQAGKKHGFKDNKSGNLFFAIEEILKVKKPLGYILENVSFLKNHNDGKTLKTIQKKIKDLNYTFDYQILKASDYGLPTYRPRIFMVGFNKSMINSQYHGVSFKFPNKKNLKKTMSNILKGFCSKDFKGNQERKIGFTLRVGGGRSGVLDKRNWDSYIVDKKIIRIEPRHGLEMMGFPKSYLFPVSNTQALKQLGNTVAVNVVKEVGKSFLAFLNSYKKN